MNQLNSQETVLTIKNVCKSYSTVKAVNDVSLEVRRGEIFALLGPNGAGKTTLVRMLMGINQPDSGEIKWNLNGKQGEALTNALGYLPEERGFVTDLPIMRTLLFFAGLRGAVGNAVEQRALDWLERLELKDRANEKVATLSKGNQQKIQFVSSILHQPDFVVLDEPFSGFDPVNQEKFCDLILELRNQGMTVLLSAHQMALVEKLADRIYLLNLGKVILSGTLEEIRQEAKVGNLVTLKFDQPVSAGELENIPNVSRVDHIVESDSWQVTLQAGASVGEFLSHASRTGEIQDVHTGKLTLHEIYLKAVSGTVSPAPSASTENVQDLQEVAR